MKQICVFCASSDGANPSYLELAKQTGKLLAARNIGLVYGGAKIGLMGAVANAVLEHGGSVTGVLPHFLSNEEVAHKGLTELIMVDSMHQRKLKMSELADAFITLPGGFGTLEELSEILTWSQLGLHQKPIGIIDHKGFYTHFIQQLDLMVREGLLRQANRDLLLVADDPQNLLEQLLQFQHPENKHIMVDKAQS